jgi:FKBP-type peptidyl-prolyl cis-trans isomerase
MMDKRLIAVAGAALLVVGCAGERQADLETFADSASYAIGMNMGASVQQVRDQVDLDVLMRGISDMADGEETKLTQQDAMRILQQFASQMQEGGQEELAAQTDSNRAVGEAYRTEFGAREGVTTTESGLQYEILTQTDGPKPEATDRVRVHYRGMLVDGTEFESSYERDPVVFPLNQVIPGWTEGVQLMSVGSKYRFVIPPELAYGEGRGPGGPGSTLVFEVELLDIVE